MKWNYPHWVTTQLVDYVEQTSDSFLPLNSALLSLSRNGVKIVRKRSKHCINYDFCNNKLSKPKSLLQNCQFITPTETEVKLNGLGGCSHTALTLRFAEMILVKPELLVASSPIH